jgi:site-specific recombinase XerD
MTQPITPLRQRMLDDMKLRNMADCTRRTYVRAVAGFSAFHGRSPDELTLEDVRDYQLHLVARGLKASTICQVTSALRFLYAWTSPLRVALPHFAWIIRRAGCGGGAGRSRRGRTSAASAA